MPHILQFINKLCHIYTGQNSIRDLYADGQPYVYFCMTCLVIVFTHASPAIVQWFWYIPFDELVKHVDQLGTECE